ncbi:MAG: restriction endonuclease [Candidatus Nitrosopelagicus sp.]|nr:restriction endonuclease [Candidatus Nitrosopelagicus sp.]
MRLSWLVPAFIFIIIPLLGFYNVASGNFVEDRIIAWVVMIGMFLAGIACIILAITQDGSKYVTGTLIKKNSTQDYETHGTLPKGYHNSEPTLPDISDYDSFFDIKNKIWKVKNREFPIIENISESDLKWFSEKMELAGKVSAGEMEMTQEEADKIDEEVREKLYQIELGTDYKTIQSYLTQEEEGKLFGLLYNFVTQIKTIENASNHPMFNPMLLQSEELNKFDLENNFQRYTWQQAEDLVGKLFEKKNYTVTIGVPTSDGGIKRQGDFGIDVEAKNGTEYLGIQVKHWENDVGFEDVAKTLGVAQKFNKVIIVSTKSGFTSQARKHADDNPYLIELWDSNKFKDELRNYLLK